MFCAGRSQIKTFGLPTGNLSLRRVQQTRQDAGRPLTKNKSFG